VTRQFPPAMSISANEVGRDAGWPDGGDRQHSNCMLRAANSEGRSCPLRYVGASPRQRRPCKSMIAVIADTGIWSAAGKPPNIRSDWIAYSTGQSMGLPLPDFPGGGGPARTGRAC
jgi:hypothetical protein